MSQVFRATTQLHRLQLLHSPRIMLALLATLLVTAVACGTDRADGDSDFAAGSFQVEGDTLTWAPPWDEGDTRTINVTTSTELNAGAESFLDTIEEHGGERPELPRDQTVTLGSVSIIDAGSSGATGEINFSIEDLVGQLQEQSFEQPGFGDADFGQLSSMMGLIDQLDLGVEFGIDGNGAITGVTNLDDLAEEINGLADSLLRLAAFAGEDAFPGEDLERLRTLLDELPKTDAAQLVADSGINAATANMFLMRAGEYTIGQPVVVSGQTPTIIGLATDGAFTYELTGIADGAATVEVLVSPGEVDLLALMEQVIAELAPIIGDDTDDALEEFNDMDADEREQFTAITGIVFNPYTVTLTLDAETGWVTAADWSFDLSLPEGFEDLLDDDDLVDLDGISLADIGATVNVSATFE